MITIDIALSGIGKNMKKAFYKGEINESIIFSQYNRNRKEAEKFSIFGYTISDLKSLISNTHNPLLKKKIENVIKERSEKGSKSLTQNQENLNKLAKFKEDALNLGLRKVLSKLKKICWETYNPDLNLTLLMLELEYANLAAKTPGLNKDIKTKIYERKDILIGMLPELSSEANCRCGINDACGKNACYLVYSYLPDGTQLTWHSNNYYLYKEFPYVDDTWDGQVCMNMEKLLTFLETNYSKLF